MLVDQSRLSRQGHHSVDHWSRVLLNGRHLTAITGANLNVVELFSVIHDSQRHNEGFDPLHGKRAADYIHSLRGEWFNITDKEMDQLYYACETHSDGLTEADITIQTCWDADRLDLGRVGITPKPELLATVAARYPSLLRDAHERASTGYNFEASGIPLPLISDANP